MNATAGPVRWRGDGVPDGLARDTAGWAAGWAVLQVGLFAGVALNQHPALALASELAIGSAGAALGAYASSRSPRQHGSRQAGLGRRIAAWAIAFVAAALIAWYWDALARAGWLPVDAHVAGSHGRWSSASSPDPGAPAATVAPIVFGALGGSLASLTARGGASRPGAALLRGAAWAVACAIGFRVALVASYAASAVFALAGRVGGALAGRIGAVAGVALGGWLAAWIGAVIGVAVDRTCDRAAQELTV